MTDELPSIERRRLRSLVEADVPRLDALHATDFVLVHPSGGVWNKTDYIGGIASGRIDYRRFDATSDIEVMGDGDVAVLRYRSAIEISIDGQEPAQLECWHLDCYRQDGDADGGPWQVRWAQATAIAQLDVVTQPT